MVDFNMFNPNGATVTNNIPMREMPELNQYSSIEDISRYKFDHSIGAYYPIRFLKGQYVDSDSKYPIVMVPGTIVAIENIYPKDYYSSADGVTGILTSGVVNVTVGRDGNVVQRSVDLLYPRDMSGFVTICNGGVTTADQYSNADGAAGILNMSGTPVTSSHYFTRTANKPAGIVASRVYADMKERYLNYDVKREPVAIETAGVLTLPFVAIYGSGVTGTVLAAVRNAVNTKHQYVWVAGESLGDVNILLGNQAALQSDQYGKFTSWGGSDVSQKFAKILNVRLRVPHGMDAVIDSFPGSQIQGTDTGGLRSRLYDFIKSILSESAVQTASVTNAMITQMLYRPLSTATADVSIKIGQVDVAYGFIA
jgi:hypothetical protein